MTAALNLKYEYHYVQGVNVNKIIFRLTETHYMEYIEMNADFSKRFILCNNMTLYIASCVN